LNTTQPKTSRLKVHLSAPDRLIWIVVGVVVLWGVWAFGSEMLLNLRLNAQVQALRVQNAQLATSNAQTRSRLATAASATALEESARQQGYYKSGEQVYVIVQPSPSAGVSAGGAGGVGAGAGGTTARSGTSTRTQTIKGETVWGTINKWWRSVWH
jgi:cell division protein FtsB